MFESYFTYDKSSHTVTNPWINSVCNDANVVSTSATVTAPNWQYPPAKLTTKRIPMSKYFIWDFTTGIPDTNKSAYIAGTLNESEATATSSMIQDMYSLEAYLTFEIILVDMKKK